MENLSIKIKALNIYPEENIEMLVEKIGQTDGKIKKAIGNWLDTENETEITVEGIRYSDLKDKTGMNPIAAYLTLDWINRQPIEAIAALREEYPDLE